MITMTLREALKIQREQLAYYKNPKLTQAAKAATCLPVDVDLDQPLPVRDVNKLVPRGVALGALIGEEF